MPFTLFSHMFLLRVSGTGFPKSISSRKKVRFWSDSKITSEKKKRIGRRPWHASEVLQRCMA